METLAIDRAEGVTTVTMHRPEVKNAFNQVMLDELLGAFRGFERASEERVMVLTGAEGSFCSGADLGDPTGPATGDGLPGLLRMRGMHDVALALHGITKPTIAKVDGFAVGAGLSLALGCDLVVASDRAKFSAIFARRALSLDMGASWLLPRVVGMAKAKELAFFADMLTAEDALALGLINRVVPVDELDAFVTEWAERLAAGAPIALSLTKTLLDGAASESLAGALEDESRSQAINFGTADTAEALRAFVQKRSPHFTGR